MSTESSEQLSTFERKVLSALPELGIACSGTMFETIRAELVHPEVSFLGMLRSISGQPHPEPKFALSDNPLVYSLLQHSGDIWEGYIYPFIIFQGLNLTFMNNLSEKVKIGTALLLTSAALIYAEGGIRENSRLDIPDLAGGVVGMAAWYKSRRIFRHIESSGQREITEAKKSALMIDRSANRKQRKKK